MSLMYNPANEVRHNLASLATIPTPAPQGPRHHPYSFAEFANLVAEELPQAGLIVQDAEFAVSKDNQRMFGVFALQTGRSDLTWQIGVRGSHDQSIGRGLVAGERVTVCSNLMFSGAIEFRTKQSTFIEQRIRGLVIDAVEQMPGYFEAEETMIDRMKDRDVRDAAAHAALVEVFRRGGLSAAQLGKAVNEWHEPSYDHGAGNVYVLEQAVTEALKPGGDRVNMDLIAERTQTARSTFVELFKLAA